MLIWKMVRETKQFRKKEMGVVQTFNNRTEKTN